MDSTVPLGKQGECFSTNADSQILSTIWIRINITKQSRCAFWCGLSGKSCLASAVTLSLICFWTSSTFTCKGYTCLPLKWLFSNCKYNQLFCKSARLVSLLRHILHILQPTSVALPWLRACSVKLQLLWMCSFPWRRDESWTCRTCTQVNGNIRGAQRSKKNKQSREKRGKVKIIKSESWIVLTCGDLCYHPFVKCLCVFVVLPTFCLVVQMFSRSAMRAVLRWCNARSSSSKVLVISAIASVFLSFSWREISLTSSMAAVSWGSLEGDKMLKICLKFCRAKPLKKAWDFKRKLPLCVLWLQKPTFRPTA